MNSRWPVFLRAWRALPEFRGHSALNTWLYRIATRYERREAVELVSTPQAFASFGLPPELAPDHA
jgi:hypothetical protein